MANAENGAGREKPRLQRYYEETARPKLRQDLGLKNVMQLPTLEKIVINVGLGEAPKNPKLLDAVVAELGQITGQKAVVTKAKKAISNFALREGSPIGAAVTLRRERMRGIATSAACRRARSTGAATTRWA